MPVEVMHGVSDADLAQVVEDYESEGAAVSKEKDNGTWTVTATFPEDANRDDA